MIIITWKVRFGYSGGISPTRSPIQIKVALTKPSREKNAITLAIMYATIGRAVMAPMEAASTMFLPSLVLGMQIVKFYNCYIQSRYIVALCLVTCVSLSLSLSIWITFCTLYNIFIDGYHITIHIHKFPYATCI